MPVSTVTTLTEMAQGLLNVCEDALNTTDAGAPERTYLAASPPAFDCCPFLTVHVAGLAEEFTSPSGTDAARRTSFGSVILATYVVTAVRCDVIWQDNVLPTIEELQAVAVEVEQDGWALWTGIRNAHRAGTIFELCTGVHFDTGRPIPSQGGCVGWAFSMRAMIEGILPS